MTNKQEKVRLVIAGVVAGLCAFFLVVLGNPKNMGFCIACFIRDIAGALKLHQAGVVQYMRPEIPGLVLGSFLISLVAGEFRPRGGSSPLTRLMIGFFVMIGALAFLGCPFRMIIRLAGGDLNALVALAGFIAGIGVGAVFLNKGVSLGRYYRQRAFEGVAFPALQMALLVVLVGFPSLLAFSSKGPGSMHAAIAVSLVAGLVVGALGQKTRLCMVGGVRDSLLVTDWTLLCGTGALFVTLLAANLVSGNFHLGFSGQPVAHSDHLWNFLGMSLAGLGSVLLGGCPMRQLVLAGEGNSDSAMAVIGMALGAAASHNFGLAGAAASAESAGGVSLRGRIAVLIGLAFCVLIGYLKSRKSSVEMDVNKGVKA